jgi:phosphopantothenoylcysteine synthetase/decarboxylase
MNTSSGGLGVAIADEGLARGWHVDLVHGPGALVPAEHEHLSLHPVPWFTDLEPTIDSLPDPATYTAVFHTMAVLDYVPRTALSHKRASGEPWNLVLYPTPKLVDRFKARFPAAMLIAFKLEAGVDEHELVSRAARLAQRCGARIVVANLLEWVQERYRCQVVDAGGHVHADLSGREATAAWLWDFVEQHRDGTYAEPKTTVPRSMT